MRKTLAVLGAGNMGLAITDGILRCGFIPAENIILVRRSTERLENYRSLGCKVCTDMREAATEADVLLLALKPQMMELIYEAAAPVSFGKLVVSIAAGIKTEAIEKRLSGSFVVRAMPNTPLTVGEGVTEICRGKNVSDEDFSFAKGLFAGSGITVECSECDINAFTALTSSAVAYFAAVEQAMCSWAEENGLQSYDKQTICDLVSKTAMGTAKLLYEKKMSPADLIRSVASPNGTTERALKVFEEQGLNSIFDKAMTACAERAEELSNIK
ncbi:MAG: pyrroline-5-carboxylate reductase [Clostridia bacterium]|nr:pyrroline-5-carboxylate reductase [Clostridia bacterium]